MEGKNFVELVGKIKNPVIKMVGQDNNWLFKGTLAIPAPPPNKGHQFIKISSFQCAQALSEVKENTFIKINGHIEEHVYDGQCRLCGGYEKKYWTEVVIDNFVII